MSPCQGTLDSPAGSQKPKGGCTPSSFSNARTSTVRFPTCLESFARIAAAVMPNAATPAAREQATTIFAIEETQTIQGTYTWEKYNTVKKTWYVVFGS